MDADRPKRLGHGRPRCAERKHDKANNEQTERRSALCGHGDNRRCDPLRSFYDLWNGKDEMGQKTGRGI